jgi:hypothetical protein
MRFSVYLVKVR